MTLISFRNAEGYKDPTAHAAIRKCGNRMNGFVDGQIVQEYMMDGKPVYRLLIKVHTNYAVTLPLYELESRENEHIVMVNGTAYHTDLGKLQYKTQRSLEGAEPIEVLSDQKYEEIITKIAAVLGVPVSSAAVELQNKVSELFEKYDELKALYDKRGEMIEQLQAQIEQADDKPEKEIIPISKDADVARLTAERDLYKDFYFRITELLGFALARSLNMTLPQEEMEKTA